MPRRRVFHGKPCSKCGRGPRRTYSPWCQDCANAYMRSNRPKYRDLSAGARIRMNCRSYTNVLVARGKLVPQPCRCGATDVQPHHTDYSNPRLVEWLCRPCHLELHGKQDHTTQRARKAA